MLKMQATAIKIKYKNCNELGKQYAPLLTFLVSDFNSQIQLLNECFSYVLKEVIEAESGTAWQKTEYTEYTIYEGEGFTQTNDRNLVRVSLCRNCTNYPAGDAGGNYKNSDDVLPVAPAICFKDYGEKPADLKAKIITPPKKMYAWVVRRSFEKMLDEFGFGEERVHEINQAVSEAYNNAVLYGQENKNVKIEYKTSQDRVSISIINYIKDGAMLDKNFLRKINPQKEKALTGTNASMSISALDDIESRVNEFNWDTDSLHAGSPIMLAMLDNPNDSRVEIDKKRRTTTVKLEFCLNRSKQAA